MKRLRNSKKAQIRNKARKSVLNTFEKKFRAAVEASDVALAGEMLKECFSKLDKAAKAGVIHSNKVNNKKSQFDKLFNSIKQA
jgi:small subunit ribosomal protein S20